MSDPVEYDPDLFALQRTRDGETADVQIAQFTVNSGYTEDALGTLLLEADAATAAIAFWGAVPDPAPLRAGDRILATYNDVQVFSGTVDEVTLTYSTDPAGAAKRGHQTRAVLTASMIGDYAESLNRVSELAAPVQGAYARLLLIAEELQDNSLGLPTEQVSNQAVSLLQGVNTNTGEWAPPLDVIRGVSVMSTLPVRAIGPNRFAFIGTREPDLPPGLDAGDGPSLYSEYVTKTTSGAKSIALQGSIVDDIG